MLNKIFSRTNIFRLKIYSTAQYVKTSTQQYNNVYRNVFPANFQNVKYFFNSLRENKQKKVKILHDIIF